MKGFLVKIMLIVYHCILSYACSGRNVMFQSGHPQVYFLSCYFTKLKKQQIIFWKKWPDSNTWRTE